MSECPDYLNRLAKAELLALIGRLEIPDESLRWLAVRVRRMHLSNQGEAQWQRYKALLAERETRFPDGVPMQLKPQRDYFRLADQADQAAGRSLALARRANAETVL